MTIRNITRSTLIASAVLVGGMSAMTTASHALCLSPVTVHQNDGVSAYFTKATKAGAKRYAKKVWKQKVHAEFGRQFRNIGRARNRSGSYRVSPDGKRWVYELTATPCD